MRRRKWYEPRWWERKVVWKWVGAVLGCLVLASLVLPLFSREAPWGMDTEVKTKGRQVFMACHLYCADHEGVWPEDFGFMAEEEYGFGAGRSPLKLSDRFGEEMFVGEVWTLLVAGMREQELSGSTPAVLSGVEFRDGRRVVVFARGDVRMVGREELKEMVDGAN